MGKFPENRTLENPVKTRIPVTRRHLQTFLDKTVTPPIVVTPPSVLTLMCFDSTLLKSFFLMNDQTEKCSGCDSLR